MFGMDLSDPRIESLCAIGEAFFRRILHNDRSNGKHLILCGSVGTGKTRVARTIWKQIQAWAVEAQFRSGWGEVHPSSNWVDWPALCDLDRDITFTDQLQDMVEARVLFLDDVGSEADKYKGGEAASRLRRVLSCCDSKWLLLTTNLSKPDFLDQYDYRVADRLSAAHWFSLKDVPSYRPNLRECRAQSVGAD